MSNSNLYLLEASERLRDNYDIVLEVVSKDGYNLQYASDRLKDDYNIS